MSAERLDPDVPQAAIRTATREDAPTLLGLIVALATYEERADRVLATEELLAEHLFGARPSAEALLAEVDGEAVGYALFYTSFSTFLGRPGIWLEDLFVLPDQRRGGIGRALLAHVARIAVARGAGRLEWAVLDWNEPALGFYRSLGARAMPDWIAHRVDGETLRRLAAPNA